MLSAARTRLASPLLRPGKQVGQLHPSAIGPSAARASPIAGARALSLLLTPISPTRSPRTLPARAMLHTAESASRPAPDQVLADIADYVHSYDVASELAYETARLCLIDTLGCGLEGLRFPECASLLGPVVEGTVVPNGASTPSDP